MRGGPFPLLRTEITLTGRLRAVCAVVTSSRSLASMSSTYQSSGPQAPSTSRKVLATVAPQRKGYWDIQASLTTAIAGANNDLVYTAKTGGVAGNAITVTYVVAGASTPLTVSVAANAITVNVATSAGSAATSTAAQVAAAVAASAPAAALVGAVNATGNDGTGVVAALAATNLTGGVDSTRGGVSSAPLPTQHPIHDSYR